MFRVRDLLGLASALAVTLAASGAVPRVASAQEEKDFMGCPVDKICFYEDGGWNSDPVLGIPQGNPEVQEDPPPLDTDRSVCQRLVDEDLPFLAGSAVNNNSQVEVLLFADDNCRTPVDEPAGGTLIAGQNAAGMFVSPEAKSWEAVELPAAEAPAVEAPAVEAPQVDEQQLGELFGLADDGVARGDRGHQFLGKQLFGEQGVAARLRREVDEHGDGEDDDEDVGQAQLPEDTGAPQVERLELEGRGGPEPLAPLGAPLHQLGPSLDEDQQRHPTRAAGDTTHEAEQDAVEPRHVPGG